MRLPHFVRNDSATKHQLFKSVYYSKGLLSPKMKSFLETIYLNSPIFIQQIMVAVKGYSLEKERRSGEYNMFLQEVLRRKEWTSEQFSTYQLAELQKILNLSYNFVPHYNKKFREIGLFPQSIKSLQDITFLPILDKNAVRLDPIAFVDRRVNQKELLVLRTTGTTGTPLKIYTNELARRWNYAFFDGYLKSAGVDTKGKRATFGGRVIVSPIQENPPFWRLSYFQKNLLFSSYHLTDKNLPSYLEKLREYQPEIIESYPSSLYVLSDYMLNHGKIGEISPRVIVTSGETLFEDQRRIIEEAFQCKVSDQYGCVEMCVFAAQCKEGHYHYRPDYSVVEIIKDNGQVAKPGEVGEIVCTGFINPVMPLIRYRIGDMGAMGNEPCSCGLNTPYLNNIMGRMDELIFTPDGRSVGRIGPVLRGFPVKEAQYIQKSIDLIVLRLVRDSNFASQTSEQLIKEIQKRLGYSIKIELEFVDEIPRGPGGKLRTVISDIKRNSV